jgi:hypothetical protein
MLAADFVIGPYVTFPDCLPSAHCDDGVAPFPMVG